MLLLVYLFSRNRDWLLFVLLNLIASRPGLAQQDSPVFYHFSTEKGLPHDHVYDVHIDRPGIKVGLLA